MKEGDKVTVYHDTITKAHPEGKATLIHQKQRNDPFYDGHPVERWLVQFDGDTYEEACHREIHNLSIDALGVESASQSMANMLAYTK